MRVVVCTVVHHPADARIFYREIQALLDAGHDVTYIAPHGESAAPFRMKAWQDHPGTGAAVPCAPSPFPRARRAGAGSGALRAARAAMAAQAARRRPAARPRPRAAAGPAAEGQRPPTVWDVHEDTAAALTTKAWLPGWLRPVAAGRSGLRRAAGRTPPAPDPRRARLQRPLRRHPPGGAQHDVRPGRRRPRRPGRAASSTSAGSPRTGARPRWWSSAACWRRTASRSS